MYILNNFPNFLQQTGLINFIQDGSKTIFISKENSTAFNPCSNTYITFLIFLKDTIIAILYNDMY